MDFIENNNNKHTQEPYNYTKVVRTNSNLYLGEIHQKNRNSDLYGQYKVRLLDHAGAIVSCQLMNQGGGFNGVGKIVPLEIDTPVVVLFKEGQMDFGFIIGTFNTWGEYSDSYHEGKLQEVNSTDEYNQPFIHPNRITQPDSIFEVYPDKTKGERNYTQASAVTGQERSTNRAVPGVIKLHNTSGDYALYTPGQNIQYSEGNIIQVSGGSKADKVTKLNQFAQAHLTKADSLKSLRKVKKEELDYSDTEFKPLTVEQTPHDAPDGKYLNLQNGNVNQEYLFKEEYKLANAYLQLAKEENAKSHSLQSEVDRVNDNVEESEKDKSENGEITGSKYKPEITNSSTLSSNKILVENEEDKEFKYIVFHNAGDSLDEVMADVQDTSNAKGYHVIINQKKMITLANTKQRVNSVFGLSYDGDNQLDLNTYSIGFITSDNNLNIKDYKTAAYQINQLINNNLFDAEEFLTHEELQESNGVEVKDKLNFDSDIFQKHLKEFI